MAPAAAGRANCAGCWGIIPKYTAAGDWLWQKLTSFEFDEAVPPLGAMSGRRQHSPDEPRTRRRVVGRYFADRADLIGVLREFTQRLFGAAADRAGKPTWCEKTPFNLLSVPFLLELFPSATVMVIMRHPVHVTASHRDQFWAPSTLDGVLGWLAPR